MLTYALFVVIQNLFQDSTVHQSTFQYIPWLFISLNVNTRTNKNLFCFSPSCTTLYLLSSDLLQNILVRLSTYFIQLSTYQDILDSSECILCSSLLLPTVPFWKILCAWKRPTGLCRKTYLCINTYLSIAACFYAVPTLVTGCSAVAAAASEGMLLRQPQLLRLLRRPRQRRTILSVRRRPERPCCPAQWWWWLQE